LTDGEASRAPDPLPLENDLLDRHLQAGLGATVAALLHDLNQPLTALTNFLMAAQIAIEQAPTPNVIADLVDDASEQAARARAIIRQLRDHLAH
jgi:two-component system sensor kinase FixL